MRNPAKNETASPNVEASIAAKHAASMLCGAKYQNSTTAEKIVSTCSTASLQEVESDSSTAKKYPFMHVHCDINGSPSAKMRRDGAAPALPKMCAAAKSEKHSSKTAMVQSLWIMFVRIVLQIKSQKKTLNYTEKSYKHRAIRLVYLHNM